LTLSRLLKNGLNLSSSSLRIEKTDVV